MSTDDEFSKATCPFICPSYATKEKTKVYLEAGQQRDPLQSGAGPYVPGYVRPFEPQIYPPGAPPKYLPQFTDSTSGDILNMSPVGPWASGHLDWTPQAGTTGVRPVVDKYSITRYSTGEWRLNNKKVLTPVAVQRAHSMQENAQKALDNFFNTMESTNQNSNRNLDKRIKDLRSWKKKVEKAVHDITEEIEILDEYRSKIKGACRILMLPESISKECLELRTHRYEPDLMRDEAEQELIKEIAMIGEIRRVFTETLQKVEEQMKINKAAKTAIEQDWSDKVVSFNLDKQNLGLDNNSTLLQFHPGVNRWPENATTLEYWQHFCMESIRNCDEVRKKSEQLRGDLMTAIINGGQDLKTQCNRTDMALAETVAITEELCSKLEETLRENLQRIADMENFIDHLKESLRKVDISSKLVMTRLHNRNYSRLNVENCRDEAQYALMAEAKLLKETAESLTGKLRDAESIRSELMKYRGDLEKQIASKRKSLLIDGDRCRRARAFIPSPEDFARH